MTDFGGGRIQVFCPGVFGMLAVVGKRYSGRIVGITVNYSAPDFVLLVSSIKYDKAILVFAMRM
jgi:hypothetical protein